MTDRLFVDSQFLLPDAFTPLADTRRSRVIAPLAGLVAAVALFVATLTVVGRSHDLQFQATPTPAPTPDARTASLPPRQVTPPGDS